MQVEAAVDDLAFDELPPTQARPSASLGALYSSAVMRTMDPLPEQPTNTSTYLQFGDLFRKPETKKIFVCLTPACDLAFGDTRPVPSGRSILFLEGELLPIEKPLKPFQQRQPRTELIRLDGMTYRAIWNPKLLGQTTFGKLKAWLDGHKVVRVARLTTPFALDVQRGFAADLTRIGMPVPPPLYNPVTVQLLCRNAEDEAVQLTSAATSDAFVSGSERGEKVVMGPEFMDSLDDMLATAQGHAAARVKALSAPGVAAEAVALATADLEKLAAARSDVNVLSGVRGPFVLGEDGPLSALDDLLVVAREGVALDAELHAPLHLIILNPSEP